MRGKHDDAVVLILMASGCRRVDERSTHTLAAVNYLSETSGLTGRDVLTTVAGERFRNRTGLLESPEIARDVMAWA